MHTSGLALIYTLHILSYVGFVAGLAIPNYRECGHDSVNYVEDPQGMLELIHYQVGNRDSDPM